MVNYNSKQYEILEYQNNLPEKFSRIQSNNTNNVNVTFKTIIDNNWIKHKNIRATNFTKMFPYFENVDISMYYLFV